MTAPARFDEGLQPERTELSWRRTALSIAVISLVGARLLPAVFDDPLWIFPGVVGAVLSGFLWWASRRRHLRYVHAPVHEAAALPAGLLLLFTAVVVVALGATGLVVVVLLSS